MTLLDNQDRPTYSFLMTTVGKSVRWLLLNFFNELGYVRLKMVVSWLHVLFLWNLNCTTVN